MGSFCGKIGSGGKRPKIITEKRGLRFRSAITWLSQRWPSLQTKHYLMLLSDCRLACKMEQLIESLVMAGAEKEKIERARHRGLAYQCLRCLERDGFKTVKIRCRMEDHIMHVHLGRDEWPYYCELCNFKSRKYSELIDHVTVYTRHIAKANKEKIVDNRPFLKQNPNPHVFGPADFKALTPEGSLLHFMGLAGQEWTREGDMEPSRPSTQAAMAQPGCSQHHC